MTSKSRTRSSKVVRFRPVLTVPQVRTLKFAAKHGRISCATMLYRRAFSKYPTKPIRALIKLGYLKGDDESARATAKGRALAKVLP